MFLALGSAGTFISIHALREEGDCSMCCPIGRQNVFQSTPSARRATGRLFQDFRGRYISIHALREEGDAAAVVVLLTQRVFQSTPSARRATWMP